MNFISKTYFLLGAYAFLSQFSAPIHAYPGSPFNAKSLLDAADVVCYGKVAAVEGYPVEADTNFSPPLATAGATATVKVISMIKGKSASNINVVFRKSEPTQMVAYTQLAQNESAILFIKSQSGFYRFVDDHNGKLQVPLHKPLAYKSTSPVGRMAAELIFASQVDKGVTRLVCAEQLGSFALPEVVSYLSKLTSTPDIAAQGIALASLIQLDHPPQVMRLTTFFQRRNDTQSLKRFRTTLYSIGHLKARILIEMENRFNVIGRDFDSEYTAQGYVAQKKAARTGAQQWKTFDLIKFLRVATDNAPPEKDDGGNDFTSYPTMADIIANQIDSQGRPAYLNHTYRKRSRSLAARFLQSANLETSAAAARAIDLIIAEKHTFPYPQGSKQDIMRYIKTVREWIKKNSRWIKNDK